MRRGHRSEWATVVKLGMALCSLAVLPQTPTPPAPPSTVQQTGGMHIGDNVVGDKTMIDVHGDATFVLPQDHGAPAPALAAPSRVTPKKPRRLDPEQCRIRQVGFRTRIDPGFEYDFGMSLHDFVRITRDEPRIYRMMTGRRPIGTPLIEGSVDAHAFEQEVACADLAKDYCVEYDISTPDIFGRHLTRFWATEWEHLERRGLLKDPGQLDQLVRCFPEDNVISESDPAQWSLRLRSLLSLLGQEQAVPALGAALQHTLSVSVRERLAHLLILRASREPMQGALGQAAELFSQAADLEPKETWLRKAATEEFRAEKEYPRAAAEQEKLVTTLRSEPSSEGMPASLQPVAVNATLNLIELQGAAGQFDAALATLNEVRNLLDSTPRTDAAVRRRYLALAYMLTGQVFSEWKQWGRASEYYEAAANVAASPPAGEKDESLAPDTWLLHAGGLACLAADAARIGVLDRNIRAAIPYFRDDRQEPTWEVWRYLMARWWAAGRLGEREVLERAAEADRALDRLLRQPIVIAATRDAPHDAFSDNLGDTDRVASLNGLSFGESFSGGIFPAQVFVTARGNLGAATTPQLYRSILENISLATQRSKDGHLREAAEAYAVASEMAAELAKRISGSGVFLQIAVLRAQAHFLQEHNVDPVKAVRATEQADALEIGATCDERVRNAFASHREGLVESDQAIQMQTSLATVALRCPLKEQGS